MLGISRGVLTFTTRTGPSLADSPRHSGEREHLSVVTMDRPDIRPPNDQGIADLRESRPLLALAVCAAVVLFITSTGYGYYRDELYFLAAGRHLDWGYPDQPPLIPLLALIADQLFPGSLLALRTPASLAGATTVLMVGLICREMGGRRTSQLLAAACMAATPIILGVDHTLSTSSIDILCWTVVAWLFARAVRTANPRLLVGIGAVVGIGAQAKSLIAVFVIALVIAVVVAGPRRLFWSRWALLAIAVAGVLTAPTVLWQITHGWPQLEMSNVIAQRVASGRTEGAFPLEFLIISPALAPVWFAGLIALLHGREDLRPYRALGVAFLLVALIFLATGGRWYYLAGAYPAILAAGAIRARTWFPKVRRKVRITAVVATVSASALVFAGFGLPIIPASTRSDGILGTFHREAADQLVWPDLATMVADVRDRMPSSERNSAIIIAANYGQAGALEHYADTYRFPAVYSGHNGYGYWGHPPDHARVAIVVGSQEGGPARWQAPSWATNHCRELRRVATLKNRYRFYHREKGTPTWICRDPDQPWSSLWPEIRVLS